MRKPMMGDPVPRVIGAMIELEANGERDVVTACFPKGFYTQLAFELEDYETGQLLITIDSKIVDLLDSKSSFRRMRREAP